MHRAIRVIYAQPDAAEFTLICPPISEVKKGAAIYRFSILTELGRIVNDTETLG